MKASYYFESLVFTIVKNAQVVSAKLILFLNSTIVLAFNHLTKDTNSDLIHGKDKDLGKLELCIFDFVFQIRVELLFFPEEGEGEVVLLKGETVLVVGASPRRGHLLVEHNNTTLHVPYQFMELKPCNINI